MKFTITIDRLKLHVPIGVYDFEKRDGNDFEISVRIVADCDETLIASDDLAGTINYADIVGIIKNVMVHPYNLIETAAKTITDSLVESLSTTPGAKAESITVEISKLQPPIPESDLRSASVSLTVRP